jgi:uncharacterized protein YraI
MMHSFTTKADRLLAGVRRIAIERPRQMDYKSAAEFLDRRFSRDEAMKRLAHSAALLSVLAVLAARADESPYEAYIATDNVEIVAGPGHRYYATDRLPRGTKIEIYREEASGWLAIRPPEGSFSWVPAEFVERLDDASLGRVSESTSAWVGTTVEHVVEHHQQVTLKAGELVQILGEKSAAAKRDVERKWFKIAPPAGEYRWVYLRDVSRQQPEDPEPVEPQVVEQAITPALSSRERAKEDPQRLELIGNAIALRSVDERPARLDRAVEPAQYRSSTPSTAATPVSPDGFVPRKRRGEEVPAAITPAPSRTTTTPFVRPSLEPPARLASAAPSTIRSISPQANSGLGGDQLDWQLNQIEIDLSLMVAQDRSQWNLAALRRRVETLVESGADPAARGRARLVLDKISQFEDVFDRDIRTVAGPAGQAGAASRTNDKPPSGSLADPRYDAQGVLKPVVSRKTDKPAAPFAVVDSEGKPLCFVSPSPGLNLQRYVNKPVGLYGRRGYLEELKKPHLVAERVIELDGQWR